MTASTHSAVVGAGIVGICTALQLQQTGRRVTLIDRAAAGEGTSSGNAGIVSVDSVHPEALPGIWREIPGMVLRPLAPVALRPAYLPRFLPWLLRFLASSSQVRAEASSAALHAISNPGLDYLRPLAREADADDLLCQRGLLYVYETDREYAAAKCASAFLERRGVTFENLDGDRLEDLEPALRSGLAGGIYVPAAGHTLSPLGLSRALFALFTRRGGAFRQGAVEDFRTGNRRVTAIGDGSDLSCDELFVTAGAWSHRLAARLGSRVPLDTERGYHQDLPDPGMTLERPILFPARGFAATSMRGALRLAGTVEFAGLEAPPDYRRAAVLARQATDLLPGLQTEGGRSWMGYRPSLPDSLPVISPSPHFDNVWYGFGHGHLGLTQAAVTGAMLTAMATGENTPVDPSPFRIDRRF